MERDSTREDMERLMSMNPSGEIAGSEEEKIDEETIEIVYPTTAKERVEQELDELNGKIVKLTCFLYGRKIAERVVTAEMRALLSFVFLRCFVCGGCLKGEA